MSSIVPPARDSKDDDLPECEHHSWAGLMDLLDEHWPEDIFPTREDDLTRDAGARIVSLIRWVDRLRLPLSDEHVGFRFESTGDAFCRICGYSWPCPTVRGNA